MYKEASSHGCCKMICSHSARSSPLSYASLPAALNTSTHQCAGPAAAAAIRPVCVRDHDDGSRRGPVAAQASSYLSAGVRTPLWGAKQDQRLHYLCNCQPRHVGISFCFPLALPSPDALLVQLCYMWHNMMQERACQR